MPINPRILAGAGIAGVPLAFLAGRKMRPAQPSKPRPQPVRELISSVGKDLSEYLGNGPALTGAGVGALVGGSIAQHLRQPLSAGARPVKLGKRPEELIPGAGLGAAAGVALANLLRDAYQPRTMERYDEA